MVAKKDLERRSIRLGFVSAGPVFCLNARPIPSQGRPRMN